ncbi:MAG: hypothetical protein IJD12_05885 [Tidjanibacter sp.]|nr:hypothetical protein [Tidjanibacter sp.]
MKKTLFAIAMLAVALVACEKGPGEGAEKLDATIALAEGVEATLAEGVAYGSPLAIKGTVTTTAPLTEVVLTGVAKNGNAYAAKGSAQTLEQDGNEVDVLWFADTKEATHLEVKLVAGNKAASFYYALGAVEGELAGSAWAMSTVALYADNKVAHNVNDNVTYPEENTGAGSDTKSFFSMHGVEINGKVEHILSLNELLTVDGKNASMCWVNCLEKTDALPKEGKEGLDALTFIGGQRGYMFTGMKKTSLGGGTTGRQCDTQKYGEHQIVDANIDVNFTFKAINGSWIGEKYKDEEYKFIDAIWLSINDELTTEADKMRAFYQLSKIQQKLDNATLGVEEEPTSLGGKTYLRRWTNAGQTSATAPTEGFRAGDYIIIRSERTVGENTVYYYGLIQVLQLVDDSQMFTLPSTKGDWMCIEHSAAYELFMKPNYFAVKSQMEIAK